MSPYIYKGLKDFKPKKWGAFLVYYIFYNFFSFTNKYHHNLKKFQINFQFFCPSFIFLQSYCKKLIKTIY